MTRDALGLWLADIAANFVIVVVIVLAIAARFGAGTETVATPVRFKIERHAPLGGADAVEILRQRVLPGSSLAIADITPDGLRSDTTQPQAFMLLSPAGVSRLENGLPDDALIFHVPDALSNGEGDWNASFLALADVAANEARFRDDLIDLLTSSSQRAAGEGLIGTDGEARTLTDRLLAFFRTLRDIASLSLLLAVIWALLAVRRRIIRA